MICRNCLNASLTVPDEVTVTRKVWKLVDPTTMKLVEETINTSKDLKETMEWAKGIFKYVFFCKVRKAIVVGTDSPASAIKECKDFVKKT